jgi:hypothetical protein
MKMVTRNNSKVVLCALLWLVFFLPGCTSALPRYSSENSLQETPPFLPPTAQSVLPSLTAGTAEPTITPAVICKDQLTFLSDLTIPDGAVVSPNSTLDKRWEVENSGNCNWDGNYRIRLIAGPDLSAQKEQALYPARNGTRATIRLVFKAPLEPGSYRSAWQAFNPRGEPFGDPFFIDILVE